MRLIDADAIPESTTAISTDGRLFVAWSEIVKAPTIEAEPVRHGRWEECDWVEYDGHGECVHHPNEGCVCTNCRNAFKKEFVLNPRVNFCPHCGAKMDLEVDNAAD